MQAAVTAVSLSADHTFSKEPRGEIRLVAGFGVEGDAHFGRTVRHRARVARDPTQPNLRQVHLLHAELFDELREMGFVLSPGDMGENITTRGLDLLGLPEGALIHAGEAAVIEVTGLRNPCRLIDDFRPGLMAAVLGRAPDGALVRKAGVMGRVIASGRVRPGDRLRLELPPPPHRPLEPV